MSSMDTRKSEKYSRSEILGEKKKFDGFYSTYRKGCFYLGFEREKDTKEGKKAVLKEEGASCGKGIVKAWEEGPWITN